MKSVKFLPLIESYKELRDSLDNAYHRVMDSGYYIAGTELKAFESEYAAWSQQAGCVGVGNGLDALVLSLKVLNVGPGDEVIVPAHTFIATWLAVSMLGATPVPVDISLEDFCIDPALVKRAITSKTRCIIAVNLYGQLAQLNQLRQIAQEHNIFLLQDAAQSQGAMEAVGASQLDKELIATSFYPGKNLGAFGDAGAVVSNNQQLLDQIKRLRNYGSDMRYEHKELGVNSRLDELQAAFLREKLRHLTEWNERRKSIANIYNLNIVNKHVELPKLIRYESHVWHLYVVLVKNRADFIQYMSSKGVECSIHYPTPCHQQIAYHEYGHINMPVAEYVCQSCVSLPISPFLSKDDIECVVSVVNDYDAE